MSKVLSVWENGVEMTDYRLVRKSWGACGCRSCGWAEVAFLLLSQRSRIHHAYKKPVFGVRAVPEIVATWMLRNASPWIVRENDD